MQCISRLLRPLESDGKKVTPLFVHGEGYSTRGAWPMTQLVSGLITNVRCSFVFVFHFLELMDWVANHGLQTSLAIGVLNVTSSRGSTSKPATLAC